MAARLIVDREIWRFRNFTLSTNASPSSCFAFPRNHVAIRPWEACLRYEILKEVWNQTDLFSRCPHYQRHRCIVRGPVPRSQYVFPRTVNRISSSYPSYLEYIYLLIIDLVGWGRTQAEPGFGASHDSTSVKARTINLIASVRTVMRSKSTLMSFSRCLLFSISHCDLTESIMSQGRRQD